MYEQSVPSLWAEKAEVSKQVLIWKFFMEGLDIPGWEWIRIIPDQEYAGGKLQTAMWRKTDDDTGQLIKIDTVEATSWQHAQQVLLELLGSSTALHPEDFDTGGEIGDIAWLGGEEMQVAAVFIRANMVVRVNSVGNQYVSVNDTVRLIDRLFIDVPQPSVEGVIPKIEQFSLTKPTSQPGEPVPLEIAAHDPLDRPVWYKLHADRGEFSIVDDRVNFSSPSPGSSKLSLFVINENGFVAVSTLTHEAVK